MRRFIRPKPLMTRKVRLLHSAAQTPASSSPSIRSESKYTSSSLDQGAKSLSRAETLSKPDPKNTSNSSGIPPRMRKKAAQELKDAGILNQVILIYPFWVRIFHWGFAFAVISLALSGILLHQPLDFLQIKHTTLFVVHVISGWLALAFWFLRIADIILRHDTSLLPAGIREYKSVPEIMSYYFFKRKTPPPLRKYNVVQKTIFLSWLFLFIVAALLGLTSYWEGEHLAWVLELSGGLQAIRWTKYFIAIYFLSTIALHIYLSTTQSFSQFQAMITGYERRIPKNRS